MAECVGDRWPVVNAARIYAGKGRIRVGGGTVTVPKLTLPTYSSASRDSPRLGIRQRDEFTWSASLGLSIRIAMEV